MLERFIHMRKDKHKLLAGLFLVGVDTQPALLGRTVAQTRPVYVVRNVKDIGLQCDNPDSEESREGTSSCLKGRQV